MEGLRGYGEAAPSLATVFLATLGGLLLDRDTIGDTARTEAAFTASLDLLDRRRESEEAVR